MEIIIGKLGNQKTKITEPTVSRKHCKVTPNGDGTYTIENLSQSGTKVDGVEIIRTTAKLTSRLQLGPVFSATLAELIGAPATSPKPNPQPQQNPTPQPKPKPEPKVFNISHLRRVWDDYNNTNLTMAEQQRKVNLIRSVCGIFTMCAMPTISFLGPEIGFSLTGLGIAGNVYSFLGVKNAETAAEKQQRQDEFEEAWVCPNPDCGHTLAAKNYKKLVRDYVNKEVSCPYCKCKYVER